MSGELAPVPDSADPPIPAEQERAQSGKPAPEAETPVAEPPQQLPCGADVDELLEQVAEGRGGERTPHQRECVHCQATLAELTVLWEPVATGFGAPVAVPDGFTAAVMSKVRRLAKDVWYTLELTDGGKITIAARIVATVARDAARRVPGVRVALGRSTAEKAAQLVEKATLGHRHPNAAVGVLGRTAVVDLALATSYGSPAHDVARAVQESVIAQLRETVGLKTVQVNVTVDDVLDAG